ncbi:MAG: Gfo/Idh/MocA family oxidoreductase [Acidobacteriota bacterium]
MSTVRWGIVGPGRIAEKFATDLRVVKSARLHAVASRSVERAEAFGRRFGAKRSYGSYRELAADAEVDAVYVATPHHVHLEAAAPQLEAGKAVLVEKPIAATARQATEMVERARRADVFLMEAMWTRFVPMMEVVRRWLDEGAIGEVRLVRASFGFGKREDRPYPRRLTDPAMAGGSLLDVGIYPLMLARWVYGDPALTTRALASVGPTGVDGACSIIQSFPGGGLAELSSAVDVETHRNALIAGSRGQIEIPYFHGAQEAVLIRDGERHHVSRPFESGGFEYQIRAVGRCLGAGLTESPKMPLAESLENVRLMDAIRRQVGVAYPFDDAQGP